MKIGVITWWRNNYGSILQAFALQKVMNNFENVECEIISQYDRNPANRNNLIKKIKKNGISKTFKRSFWKFCFPKMRERTATMNLFISRNLRISEKIYNERSIYESNKIYDGFICGSDQIWNPTLTKLDSMYWLTFVDTGKIKVAYAPSIGISNANPEEISKIRTNLSNFDGISCRELSGKNFINSILEDRKCLKVVDPTFLVDKKVWDDISKKRLISCPYIFVYFLRCGKSQKKIVEKFAKKRKLKIVTIPFLEPENANLFELKFGDIKAWNASPADFISYIRNAEYIFTDSFHSSVFSIIYNKEFYIFPKKGEAQMERLISLLEENNIGNRIINKYEDIDSLNSIDWEKTNQCIIDNRKISFEYLKEFFEKR